MTTSSTPSTSTTTAAVHRGTGVAAGPILVATTGEDGAHALDAAHALATHTGAAVSVLSVVEPPAPGIPALDGSPAWLPDPEVYRALRRTRVQNRLEALFGGPAPWPIDVVVDTPARAIADAARDQRASLVIVGIGRHDVAARLLGGETALRTIRRAHTPVLAVADELLRLPARVAVAAIDFSASSVAAARAALDLLAPGGTLHLVHVWSRQPLGYPGVLALDEAYERALPARFGKVEAVLLDRARDVTILPSSLLGDCVDQLAAFARSHEADLIAAGRRGHGLVERLLVGRVTTGLVRSAPCAVLVTPEPTIGDRAALELALTGSVESDRPDEWPALLDDFSRRNLGRRTALEVDDVNFGAQAQEHGYTLLGATYDPHDDRIALMLGAPGDSSTVATHLTRSIADATSIGVQRDADGRDAALSVRHIDGQTLLTFLPDAR